MRKQLKHTVDYLMKKDDRAVMLIGDISHYLLSDIQNKHPDRFYNLGICEQSLLSLSAGLASRGKIPIVHTIAPFCVERAFEQIKIDLCYQNLEVIIVSVGGSFDYASLGCTHHCYEDIAILRAIPNIEIYLPGNANEFDNLLKETYGNGKPKYFKLTADQHSQDLYVKSNEVSILKTSQNANVTVITTGHLLENFVNEDVNINLIYCPTMSTISDKSKKEIFSMCNNKHVLVFEENSIIGGLGDMVFNILSDFSKKGFPKSFQKHGIPRKFLRSYGTAAEHRKFLNLDKTSTLQIIKDVINGGDFV